MAAALLERPAFVYDLMKFAMQSDSAPEESGEEDGLRLLSGWGPSGEEELPPRRPGEKEVSGTTADEATWEWSGSCRTTWSWWSSPGHWGWEQSVGRHRPTSCPNWSSSHPGRLSSGRLPSCRRLGAGCFDCWQTGLWGVFAGGWTAFETQSGSGATQLTIPGFWACPWLPMLSWIVNPLACCPPPGDALLGVLSGTADTTRGGELSGGTGICCGLLPSCWCTRPLTCCRTSPVPSDHWGDAEDGGGRGEWPITLEGWCASLPEKETTCRITVCSPSALPIQPWMSPWLGLMTAVAVRTSSLGELWMAESTTRGRWTPVWSCWSCVTGCLCGFWTCPVRAVGWSAYGGCSEAACTWGWRWIIAFSSRRREAHWITLWTLSSVGNTIPLVKSSWDPRNCTFWEGWSVNFWKLTMKPSRCTRWPWRRGR